MTSISKDFPTNEEPWLEVSKKEIIDTNGHSFYRIKYETNPKFRHGMIWQIAHLAAGCLLLLTIIPAIIYRKYTINLFKAGISGIEKKTATVAKNAPLINKDSTSLEKESTPLEQAASVPLAGSVAQPVFRVPRKSPQGTSPASINITPSDFSQISTSMSGDVIEDDFSAKILSCLQENETLKDLYSKDAGVSEGYTILEHTRLVLETATKWQSSFDSKVLPLVTWKEFLLFLALHDIGKGIAKESESAVFGTSITFKEQELKKTQDVLCQVMKHIGIEDKKITLFSTLLTYDSQGLYLRGLISKDEAFDNLIEMAFTANVPLNKMYDLLEVFHAVDAASYPDLFSSLFKVSGTTLVHSNHNQERVNKIRDCIHFSEEGREVLSSLANEARKRVEQDVEKIGVPLSRNGKKLFYYLRFIHGTMLIDTSEKQENKELYRKVKKDFRDILLAFANENRERSFNGTYSFIEMYERFLCKSGGRKTMNSIGSSFSDLFFQNEANQTPDSIDSFSAMIDELINFRKDYLIRYSKEKVKRFLTEEKDRLSKLIEDGKRESLPRNLSDKISSIRTDNPDSLNLLPLTFVHGSNSAIMPNLLLTDMQLIPTGRLLKMGIVPFSGELREGLVSNGVNQSWISGTSLDNGERALSYAENTSFKTILQSEIKTLEGFIEQMGKRIEQIDKNVGKIEILYEKERHITESSDYVKFGISIRRLRALSQETFSQLEPRLKEIIDRMEKDYNKCKGSEFYKRLMPKKQDPEGKLGYEHHDEYWFRHFKTTEDGIQNLKKAMTEAIYVPEGVEEFIENTFPITFGSTTLNPLTLQPENPSERCSVKATRLGRDLQYIFVAEGNQETVRNYLGREGLENGVRVVDKSHLEQAILLNRIAAPYFCDIASRKKMKARTEA